MSARDRPITVGVLYDFPQGDDGRSFEAALHGGLDATAGELAPAIGLEAVAVRGLPAGTDEEVAEGFARLVASAASLVVGPSISDNALVVARLADEAGLPCVNYSGGERTRSRWMFQYQVGSLEEEPLLLADRMAERGLRRAVVVHDESVVGRRYRECFEHACAGRGHEVLRTVVLDPLTQSADEVLAALSPGEPDVVVYLGLGVSSRAVALALASAPGMPVLANSALMFGYARTDWRDGYRGWEYVDTVSDDNRERAALRTGAARAAAGPIGCAAFDIGRLVGDGLARAGAGSSRAAVRDALEQVKGLRATSGYDGTTMGFGTWDHGALKGPYLVLREWRDGRTHQVPRPGR